MTDEDLMSMAQDANDGINNVDCFGVADPIRLCGATAELEKRGYEISESTKLEFTQKGVA